MTALNPASQCRTLTHLYLFEKKTESSLTLRIYDLWQKCLSKTTFSFSQLEITSKEFSLTDPSMLLEKLRQKNLIPLESIPSTPTAEECLKDIEHIIMQVKPKVLFESKELEKFTCPLSLDVFLEPVIDEHGHTFEKSFIEEQLKIKNECPINRQPIDSLTPNRVLQQFIEEVKQQDPIPTFALFKKQNMKLASSSLQMVIDCIKAKEYEGALNAYITALQYTKDWSSYKSLPGLFDLMEQKDKALLARLYLIQYQLQDKKVEDALQTIEKCRISDPELIQICPLLIKLYRCTRQTSKAITLALEIGEVLAKKHPKEAILVYKQIITEDPYQFTAYPLLVSLLSDPREKAHIFLKGACHAVQKKKYELARDFCREAEKLYEDSFVDRLIELDLLAKQGKLPKEKLLQIAALYEKKSLPAPMIKAYRMLAQLEYDPSYYEKIITTYDKIKKPEKALQWTHNYLAPLIERKEWQQVATTLHDLGDAYYFQEQYDKAIQFYERALEIKEKTLGKDHPDVATTLRSLGLVYKAQERYDKSIEYFKRVLEVLEISEKDLGNHYLVGFTLFYLRSAYDAQGSVYKAQKQYDKAIKCFKRELEINEKRKDFSFVVFSLNKLGKVYYAQKQYDKAIKYFERALARASSFNFSLVADSLNNLGKVYQAQEQYNKAIQFYERALEIEGKALEKDNPTLASSLNSLRRYEAQEEIQGQRSKAIKLEVEEIDFALLAKHLTIATSLNGLGSSHRAQKQYGKGIECFKQALEIRKKVLGKDNPKTLQALENLENCKKDSSTSICILQ